MFMKALLNKVKTTMTKNKKRKFVTFLLIIWLSYSVGWQVYNLEPVTNVTQIYGAEISIFNTGDGYEGYTVFMLGSRSGNLIDYLFGGMPTDGQMIDDIETYLVIIDMDGNVVRSRPMSYQGTAGSLIGGLSPVEVWNSTTLSIANNTGIYLWNLKTNTEYQVPNVFGHHEVEYNTNNNTFFVFQQVYETVDGIEYGSDKVVEYDLNGTVVWECDITPYVDVEWHCPVDNAQGDDVRDLTHSNTINYDPELDVLYLNVRNIDGIFAIEHATGDLLWHVGRYGDYTMYDINGNEVSKLFSHSHATKLVAPDTFITFDNDQHNLELRPFSALPLGETMNTMIQQSRIVEFKINHTTKTANETWVWVSPDYMHQPMWGDAYRFPNGNRFGVFGAPPIFRHLGMITDKGPQMVELDEDGNVVWKLTIRSDNGRFFGVYRAMRLPYDTWDFM